MVQHLNSRSFIDPETLSRLSRLHLNARKAVNGNYSGLHKSTHKGASSEFSQYRNYTRGDDISLIDWKIYGRSDRYYIKEFDADTNMRLFLLLDCSASMSFKTLGDSKFELARKIVAALAHIGIQQGDAVGLHTFSSKEQFFIPPKTNPRHLRIINDQLAKINLTGETNIGETLNDLAVKIPKRSMVVLLSDLFEEPDDIIKGIKHLIYRKHDVAVFHLLNPLELSFEIENPTTFLDKESNTQLSADPQLMKQNYLKYFEEYLIKIKGECLSAGVDYLKIKTDQVFEEVLASFLLSRMHT